MIILFTKNIVFDKNKVEIFDENSIYILYICQMKYE